MEYKGVCETECLALLRRAKQRSDLQEAVFKVRLSNEEIEDGWPTFESSGVWNNNHKCIYWSGLVQVGTSYGCKSEKPKKHECINTWKNLRWPKVGHLGLGGVELSFRDIDGGRYKHDRDVCKGWDINPGFIRAKASGWQWALRDGMFGWWRINVNNMSVLLVEEGRWSIVEFCYLCRRAIHNFVVKPIVFRVINNKGGIDGRKLE